MATVVLLLDTRSKTATRFPVCLRLTHKGVPKMIQTGYKLSSSDWNADKQKVKNSYLNSSRVNTQIYGKLSIAEETIEKYNFHLKEMSVYQLAEVIEKMIVKYKEEKSGVVLASGQTTLKDYGAKVVDLYRKSGSYGMVTLFEFAIKSMITFHGSDKLLLTDIDEVYLMSFEADCRSRGLNTNYIGIQLRQIRRIYNLAIKDKTTEVTKKDYPFGPDAYSIKKQKAKKRAVDSSFINVIRELDYKPESTIWHHRNYLLFMFNMWGMNFIDLAHLTCKNIEGDRIRYKRRKTKRGETIKEFNIPINDEARTILDYYLKVERKGNLVFPEMESLIELEDKEEVYRKYHYKRTNHNRFLNKIGEDANLPHRLTTYVIRHTFATSGLRKGVPRALIGDLLGHTNYNTTEAYLDGFEHDALDDAANTILN